MASLECTIREFHKFIGPMVRNDIQSLTRKRKRDLGYRCEECRKVKKPLDAAHVGESRPQIIERILKSYSVRGKADTVRIDLAKVRQEILDAHKPIEEHIRLLCRQCHEKQHVRLALERAKK